MTKKLKPEASENAEATIKAAETTEIPRVKYSISMNGNSTKTNPVNPNTIKSKVTEVKTKDTNLKGLLAQIKEHPEVLKLLDKATLHKNTIKNYKKEDFVKTFRAVLASTLKTMDLAINFVTHKEAPEDGVKRNEVVQQARPAILFGVWVCIITFGVFGVWAALAPLSSSAGASGTVVVHTIKKTIQHKEGGIVEDIFVKDGDHVKAGQELLKLSPIDLQSQVTSYEAQIDAINKQLDLIKEQVKNYSGLFEKGLVSRSQLLDMQLKEANAEGNLSDYKSRIIAAKDQMSRLVVTSPIDGIVNQLMVHTIGGVIRPGEPLMFIIPQDDNLVIDAMVDPKDIDSVHVGLVAKVNITAFRHRSTSPLSGVVVQVSPDVIELGGDRGMARPVYKVRIEVDKAQLTKISRLKNYELYPGMQAEVMIVTGQRTFLQYLLDPITNTFWHAFNEK